MKNSSSAIRRTADRPDLQPMQGEQRKIAAILAAFSLEMQSFGLNYALVICDPERQNETETVLGFGSNVSQEAGSLMFATFLALQKDKNATSTVLSVAIPSPAAPENVN